MQKIDLIREEINFLISDFGGFTVNINGALLKFIYFSLVFLFFLLMYLLGRIIVRNYFKNINKKLKPFIEVSIGYIIFSTTVFLLGFFSILNNFFIILLVFVLAVIGFIDLFRYPLSFGFLNKLTRVNFYKILSLILVIIYLIRLLPPPVNGDGLDYHISFPRIYLYEKTIMIPPLGDESYTTVPHLPEMLFIVSEVISHGEMSRIIHFGFFILVFLLLYNYNPISSKYQKIGPISALIFATAPLVLHIGTSSFSDFPAMLCLMISGYLLTEKNYSKRLIILSGILMGGALASKIWVFVIFPFYVLFLVIMLKKIVKKPIFEYVLLFVASSLSIPLIWLVRSFILTGNIFYINENLGKNYAKLSLIKYIASPFNSNYLFNRFGSTFDFGFVYLPGLVLFLAKIGSIKKSFNKYLFLVSLLTFSALILPFSFSSGRYALPYMIPFFTVAAAGFAFYFHLRLIKAVFYFLICGMTAYYAFNSLLQVPYGFGWANQEAYIRRNLIKDPVSYYDFNGTFRRNISTGQVVLTYGMRGFAYANFIHRNIYYFMDQQTGKLILPVNKLNKLLIRGGDFNWMCIKEKISNCADYDITLLTHDANSGLFLYSIVYE